MTLQEGIQLSPFSPSPQGEGLESGPGPGLGLVRTRARNGGESGLGPGLGFIGAENSLITRCRGVSSWIGVETVQKLARCKSKALADSAKFVVSQLRAEDHDLWEARAQ